MPRRLVRTCQHSVGSCEPPRVSRRLVGELRRFGVLDNLSKVSGFRFGWRDVADGFDQSAMVEPVDLLERGLLDVFAALPG